MPLQSPAWSQKRPQNEGGEMTEDLKLPPLPEPDGVGIDCDTDDGSYWYAPAMREYARAAVLAERERCAKLCDEISAQLKGQVPSRGGGISPTYGGVVGAAKCAAAIRGNG
jgi:hypothetical protein